LDSCIVRIHAQDSAKKSQGVITAIIFVSFKSQMWGYGWLRRPGLPSFYEEFVSKNEGGVALFPRVVGNS
jgi:hypothetical protein